MKKTSGLKQGDKVIYMGEVRTIYDIYSETKVSLSLIDYEDTEEDFQTDVSELELVK